MPKSEDVRPTDQPQAPPRAPLPGQPPRRWRPGQEGAPPDAELRPDLAEPAKGGPTTLGEPGPWPHESAQARASAPQWAAAHRELTEGTESHPPVADAPVPESGSEDPAEGGKVVILHGAVGGLWRQGDVVPVAAMREIDGIDLRRLREIGALRPASPEEAAQERVTVGTGPAAVALEVRLNEVNQRLRDREQEISDLREQLRQAKQGAPAESARRAEQAADVKKLEQACREKDKQIADLQELLKAAQEEDSGGKKKK